MNTAKVFTYALIVLCGYCISSYAALPETKKDTTQAQSEKSSYTIEKPGTITFTVGVKIKGKVEKPQVVIFLPKEKPVYNKTTFSCSFKDDIMEPLPFTPVF
jgi:hypothetical protein